MKPNYGLDAPGVVRNFGLIGAAAWLCGGFIYFFLSESHPALAKTLTINCAFGGCWFFGTALMMIWGSLSGKFGLRDRVLNTIPWRGDERVLDVGCGRGLMVIGAGKRLTSGTAIGIDLWNTEDQSGSSAENARINARLEGVQDRVVIRDGDAREIPYPDGYFDVVVSSFCIHNIYDEEGRQQAIREIVRVLRPGGHVALMDIRHCGEYAQILNECGLLNVHIGGPSFIFVVPTNWVTGRKA